MDDNFYTKAIRFLSQRPRSEKEVFDYLTKKKASQSHIGIILKKLKEQKFLDDTAFTKWWIESRMRFKPKGWNIIHQELRMKGVAEDIIDSLKTVPSVEEQAIHTLIAKKMRFLKYIEKGKMYKKLAGFLIRKGFSFEKIKPYIDEIMKK
jgi:regulatory protein